MTERIPIIGYTAGVFDMFHLGHLNLLKAARERCDHLIVGVTTDELATEVKGRPPVIPLRERMEIVQSMRCVDSVVPQDSMDKSDAQRWLGFDRLFVGENMQGPEWHRWQQVLGDVGVEVVFLPATLDDAGNLLERNEDHAREALT